MKTIEKYQWPEPYTSAIVLTVDVDSFTPLSWRTKNNLKNHYAEFEQRMFGITQGIPRIIDLLQEKQVPATFFVPSLVAEKFPYLLPEIVEKGFEVGLHGHCHEDFTEIEDAKVEEILEKGISIFTKQIAQKKFGFRAPYFKMRSSLIDLLIKNQILYDSSLMRFDHPYSIGDLTELPVDWTFDDALYWLFAGNSFDTLPPISPSNAIENWKGNVRSMMKTSSLINLAIHPWVSGRSYNLEKIGMLIDFIRDQKSLWLASAAQVAKYHENSGNFSHFKQLNND